LGKGHVNFFSNCNPVLDEFILNGEEATGPVDFPFPFAPAKTVAIGLYFLSFIRIEAWG
jgi:hypothetical protein